MGRRWLQQIEALLICIGGLLFLVELSNSVRSNIWWIGESVLTEPRFALYLWAAVALGILFVIEGVLALRERTAGLGFLCLQGPLAIAVLIALLCIAHGWRIRTDVAPADAISGLSNLPVPVRILADPWYAGSLIGLVAVCVAWSLRPASLRRSG
jgi:hypothetical protein